MKVVILCGGFGTRIRDVADDIPKPLIPIGGLPILWHIMKYYSFFGLNDFVLCCGYKANMIKDFFVNYETSTNDFTIKLGQSKSIKFHNRHAESNWTVTLADTGQNAMTGARVKRIKSYIGNDEHFLLTYGDGVGNVNISELIEFHKRHGKILTMTGVRPPSRWGEIEHDANGKVVQFSEKPQAAAGIINGGYFVCRREIFDVLSDAEDLIFESDPMKELVKRGELMVYQHEGFWQAMDTYRDFKYLSDLASKPGAPWIVWK